MVFKIPALHSRILKINIDPRSGKLWKFFTTDTKEEIHPNNLLNLPMIFQFNDVVNPLYINDLNQNGFKDNGKKGMEETSVTMEELNKIFPDSNFIMMYIDIDDGTFSKVPAVFNP